MDDIEIIELFFERSEQAIIELSNKYGAICNKVADNILNNRLDSEECVNDAYLGVWNTIPPQRPNPLLSYVCRIVRNLALKKYHENTAQKRNSYYDVALDEIADCIPASFSVEDEIMAKEKVDEIISSVDKNHNIDGLDDKTVEKFKNTLDLLVDGTVKSVGFEFADNVGTITATANAMGKVTVERKLTIKEKV